MPRGRAHRLSRALPLSPESRKVAAVLVIVTAASGMPTTEAKALPVARWHLRQWQMPTKAGSPSAV